MLLEFIIIIATIFIISICFYKQTNPEYRILQVEGGDLANLLPLIPELSPTVIRGFQTPNFWTQEDIAASPRLQQIPLVYSGFKPFPLAQAQTILLPQSPSATSELLAQETGIQVWATHTILPVFASLWYGPALQLKTKALIGTAGLQNTTALQTLIMPTQGDIKATILHKRQFPFFPSNWKSTHPDEWTKAMTPLVGEIQFIDIIIRRGSMLALPPHWYFSYKGLTSTPSKKPMAVLMEVHHPISILAPH
jgi:hypothetical protein